VNKHFVLFTQEDWDSRKDEIVNLLRTTTIRQIKYQLIDNKDRDARCIAGLILTETFGIPIVRDAMGWKLKIWRTGENSFGSKRARLFGARIVQRLQHYGDLMDYSFHGMADVIEEYGFLYLAMEAGYVPPVEP